MNCINKQGKSPQKFLSGFYLTSGSDLTVNTVCHSKHFDLDSTQQSISHSSLTSLSTEYFRSDSRDAVLVEPRGFGFVVMSV